jgi:regulator of sigma E protease
LETVIYVWTIFKAALGLGFVIFIHELGHFLLAKWNGVKVEKFSIGFGPTLASFRRGVGLRIGTNTRPPGPGDPPTYGETEYILAALPLGGYVKMLGESHEESTPEEKASTDPRAYHNKSVFARMQIITAGVIMNVILGVACFTFAYTQGMPSQPAKIGWVLPGAPAYKAGLRVGDEIVAIDGRRDVGFKELLTRVNMSGAGQKLQFTIKRASTGAEEVVGIEPLRDLSNAVPTIGILSAHGLDLLDKPFRAMPGQDVPKEKPSLGFEPEDRVVAVGPEGGPLEAVSDEAGLLAQLSKHADKPIVVEVERKQPEGGTSAPTRATVTVPTHSFLDFGFRLTPGPIAAIRPDSPAAKAGLKEGDRIVAVAGKADYDPMTLPDLARDSAGTPLALTVERAEGGKPASNIEVTITPDSSPTWVHPSDPYRRPVLVPLDVPALGLAMAILPKIQAVADGSPAAKADLKAGDSLRSIILTRVADEDEKAKNKPKPLTIKLDESASGWPVAYDYIQQIPLESIELTTSRTDKPVKVIPEIAEGRRHPLRGLAFQALIRKGEPLGLAPALARGTEETGENIVGIFRMFKGMYQGRIGGDAVGGVIPIAQIAYSAASAGWTPFIQILGMLSISLAVLNFLPIPPLDGGQFAILTMEKARGKPMPDAFVNVATIAGLVFVLGLILVINGRDIFKLVQSYF